METQGTLEIMHKIALLTFVVMVGSTIPATPVCAQQQVGIPNVGGVGGMSTARPQRRLHRNRTPALSPSLNLVPGVVGTFGGQFLLRQVPQEQALRANAQATRNFERLESQVRAQQVEIRTGLGQSGHPATFMSYGRYYQVNGAGGGGGGRH